MKTEDYHRHLKIERGVIVYLSLRLRRILNGRDNIDARLVDIFKL